MTRRDVLCVALIVVGVVCVIYGTAYFVSTLVSMVLSVEALARTTPGRFPLASYYYIVGFVWPVIFVTAGIILLRYNERIAEALTSESRPAILSLLDGWERSVFGLALRVIGVIWLIRYVPHVVRTVAWAVTRLTQAGQWPSGWDALVGIFESTFKRTDPYGSSGLLGVLVVLAIGVYFVTGARHLVNFVFRTRRAGRRSPIKGRRRRVL